MNSTKDRVLKFYHIKIIKMIVGKMPEPAYYSRNLSLSDKLLLLYCARFNLKVIL